MAVFAPLSDAMLHDPHAVYASLRREHPVLWDDGLQSWLLFRHSDCLRALTDGDTFLIDTAVLGEEPPPADIAGVQNLDPPRHTALRTALVTALHRIDTEDWVRRCAAYARGLVADHDGVLDVVSAFSEPLAAESMRLLFGVPDFGPPAAFHAAQRALHLSMDAGLEPERAAPGVAARDYLSSVLEPWIAAPPPTGLLRFVEGPTHDAVGRELVNSLRQILVAGYLSSSAMLGCAALTLAESGRWDADEPLRLDRTAVNELVRHSGAVQVDSRCCARDTELGGHRIRRGQEVLAVLAAANRDPEVFARPDELVLDRAPNPHLGFGRGIHSCLGTHLIQALHGAVLTELSERFRIRPAGPPQLRRTGTLRGLERLPLDLRPR